MISLCSFGLRIRISTKFAMVADMIDGGGLTRILYIYVLKADSLFMHPLSVFSSGSSVDVKVITYFLNKSFRRSCVIV